VALGDGSFSCGLSHDAIPRWRWEVASKMAGRSQAEHWDGGGLERGVLGQAVVGESLMHGSLDVIHLVLNLTLSSFLLLRCDSSEYPVLVQQFQPQLLDRVEERGSGDLAQKVKNCRRFSESTAVGASPQVPGAEKYSQWCRTPGRKWASG
jgi:hypothetical protein